MKNVATYFFLLFFVLCIFSSCYSPRYVYSSAATNTPVFTKKGDSKLAGYYSFNPGETSTNTTAGKLNSGHGLDVQGAYAVTNHWAVQAAYSLRREKNYADFNLNRSDSSLIGYKRNGTEFGIGYYTCLDKRRSSFFQLFAGGGFGRSTFDDSYFTGNAPAHYFNMNVARWYIQPAIMIQSGDVFASSFSSRISFVYFKNVASDYSEEELLRYQLKEIEKGTKIFWEPAFINAFGLKKLPGIKLEIQMGMAFLMSQRFVDYRTFNISVGLMLDIPKLFDNKSADKN